ncbi:MAG: DUF2461 domain-containing protein [Chloroflexi bacterium]|nr:DUF2461 domain-containing protein [Chloroflexota bacterium]
MKNSFDLKPTLTFLAQLESHNNKAWFDAHRSEYLRAKTNFENFVDCFIADFRPIENFGDLAAASCTFRINRDIRFSKDKSPYKTNMGAHIMRGGRKSGLLGYYINLAPHDESFLAGGMHMPESEPLNKFRQAIDRDAKKFEKIVGRKEFVQAFGKIEGEKLKTAPQGFARDHPAIEWLKLKEVVAMHRLTDKQVLSADFLPNTIQTFKALKPFIDHLNSVTR